MDVIANYYVESEWQIEKAARSIAAEQSTGTWTSVSTSQKGSGLDARVIKAEGNFCEIAFPEELFEPLNFPQYLSVIAGNLFGLGAIENVRLLDVEFPGKLVKMHKGPRFGIEDARKILGVHDRPLVGTIIKPKVGLSPKRTAEVAFDAAMGGLDLIKDDETLANQKFCPIEERIELVMEKLYRVEEATGKKVFYAVNVTTGARDIVERAEKVAELGANMVMVDVLTAGFDALAALAQEIKLPIHVHRTMHGAITRNRKHGIAMLPLARLVRMAGGTNLHTGSYKGKMDRAKEENDACRDALRQDWHGLKKVFPVASGGIFPANVAENLEGYGKDCIVQAGGGVHGHPGGSTDGAAAMVQAVEAWVEGMSIDDYANEHRELKEAIEYWGRNPQIEY
ncbi:MAG TPA: ribulose 1,5-bisphosphate carboxylase [Candidatus Methanoperedenaceae archaeon]|nr:ribulose 1,5-bisphosphate carboxylase [Candidatus Methanoperedenaceae archaeon]